MRLTNAAEAMALIERVAAQAPAAQYVRLRDRLQEHPVYILPSDCIPLDGTPTHQTFIRSNRWTTYADDGRHSYIIRAGVAVSEQPG